MKIILIKEKKCNVPTITGWLVLGGMVGILLWLITINLYPFLSINKPVAATAMVVEGWMPTSAIEKAAMEYKSNNYSLVFSTGLPIDKDDYYWMHKTFADMGAATLKRLRIDSSAIIAVSASNVKTDRTFASAYALSQWIDRSGLSIPAINVVSLGPHSRRSWLLFKKALGENMQVGILSYPDETYDPRAWWTSSDGFRTVTDELIAYVYVKFLFRQK